MSHPLGGERGQVAPLLALLAVGVGLACLALGRFGADAAGEASVQVAADAAALAAAPDGAVGEASAREVAAANGAEVVDFEAAGGEVRVRVRDRTGAHQATARARARAEAPTPAGDGPPGDGQVAPVLRAALARAADLLGRPVPITSGYRSPATQQRLWLARARNPYPVARPGASMHERGLAVDVPAAFADRLAAIGAQVGLCRPYPVADPVHFEPC
jgi:hypothetical protein